LISYLRIFHCFDFFLPGDEEIDRFYQFEDQYKCDERQEYGVNRVALEKDHLDRKNQNIDG